MSKNSILFKKFKEVKTPTRAYANDAGLDIYLPEDLDIKPFETVCVGLGLGFELDNDTCALLMPRSSMAKKGLIIHDAIIDSNYRGEIHLIATNCSGSYLHFKKDDRVCSLAIFNIETPILIEREELTSSERNSNGLGSSGR